MEEERLTSFAPVWNREIRILVVGSMPGALSLARGQYYANERNAFWKICEESFGYAETDRYEDKLRMLLHNGVGLWDAAAACLRKGSLDSELRNVELNDFSSLFADCAWLHTVLCNGSVAHRLFLRAVKKEKNAVRVVRLPSTSPAMASLRFEEKLSAWRPYLRGEK